MKKFIIAIIFALFAIPAVASGELFTRVSSWTLEGSERVLTQTGDQLTAVTNIAGFQSLAKCNEALAVRQARAYPAKDNALKAANSQFVGECYEVKEVIPVIEFVTPQ